ncbi:chemotaxis protein CheW [Mariprofundus erugo]|uniref:chemotaxis protein CheW n=1 Tax=Mariprofundus erugo TaxID=2528639 RepID=UPI001EE9AD52|nr:chemotaxis protein CheW [Mariprofundus erugo]
MSEQEQGRPSAAGQTGMVALLHVMVGSSALLVRSSQIREVLRPHSLTPVPMGPAHLRGLANIHGQIVCMIDIGKVTTIAASDAAQTPRTRFLILRHESMHVGIQVDDVLGIKHISEADLASADRVEGDISVTRMTVDGHSFNILDCSPLLHAGTAI